MVSLPLIPVLIAAVLVASACEEAPSSIPSAAPSVVPTASGTTVGRVQRRVALTWIAQLPVDEGANGIVFDVTSGSPYVATYSGEDSISQISPDGDQALGRYLLPDRPEFGSMVSHVVLAGRTLVLNRSLLNRLARLDLGSGKMLRELSPRDLGIAHIGAVVPGPSDHIFVLATGPLPSLPPVLADAFVLELDQQGRTVRRAIVPRIPVGMDPPSHAAGVAYDSQSGTLFFGGPSDIAGLGLISILEPNATESRPFVHPADGARILTVDGGHHAVYLASGDTSVDVYDTSSGALLRTVALDRPLGTTAYNERANVLIVTTPYRGTDADALLVLDPTTLAVLAQAEVPWDPYGHGIAFDSTGTRVYVSSRVRPASVTTLSLTVGP